jgi:hypothetical protein
MRSKRSGKFVLKQVRAACNGVTYDTYRLSGWLNGHRIRRQFKDRDEALGEKNRLEVEAANKGEIQVRATRLSAVQLADAEAAMARLGPKSLSLAVDWFLTTYKPPVAAIAIETAVKAFLAERSAHVRATALGDYRRTLQWLKAAFPGRAVHSISTADIQGFLANRGIGKKRFNNLRGDLNAFFAWCQLAPREWTTTNPVKPIPKFRILHGVPEIISAEVACKLMAFVEMYKAGAMVPYFALCLFAGIRPSFQHGEIRKIADLPDPSKPIDQALGVIRISPVVAKTKSVRQITIQPNLAEWLVRYPLSKYLLIPSNAQAMISAVRKQFALSDDVLRHTFISMHVAKFKSLAAVALEAGNSETMVRRHYLNLVGQAEAERFWSITPGMDVGSVTELNARPA